MQAIDARRFLFSDAPYSPYTKALAPLALVDAVWCVSTHHTVPFKALLFVLAASALFLAPLALPRYRRLDGLRAALLCCASFVLFSAAAAIFSYLVVSTNAPLVDAPLSHLDRLLGVDWPRAFRWFQSHPALVLVSQFAYGSVIAQIAAITMILAVTGRRERLREFNGLLVAGALVCIVISGFFPAAGPFKFYASLVHADASMLSHFEPLRDGVMRAIDPRTTQGLVSMPSFHMLMAAAIAFAMRGTRVFPLFLAINLVVAFATPFCGGHYFVDLIGGMIVLAGLIAMRRGRFRASATTARPASA